MNDTIAGEKEIGKEHETQMEGKRSSWGHNEGNWIGAAVTDGEGKPRGLSALVAIGGSETGLGLELRAIDIFM